MLELSRPMTMGATTQGDSRQALGVSCQVSGRISDTNEIC
jgi:hypothetical protein